MSITHGAMSEAMLGTPRDALRSADADEKTRVDRLLEHLLPVSPRYPGMQFDIRTAATVEHFAIEKIACPVLTISAQDDRFGTAARARAIATGVADGRALIFPSGGHALIGRSVDAMRESVALMKTG